MPAGALAPNAGRSLSPVGLKTNHPETQAAVEQAFADGSISEHAMAVSAMQAVPLRINEWMLPLVREFAGGRIQARRCRCRGAGWQAVLEPDQL
jgi:hypothetical protein